MYTEKFARNLLKLYEDWCLLPPADRGDLRARRSVNARKTDRELFQSMSLGDLWIDAAVHEVFLYLYGCKYCATLVFQF